MESLPASEALPRAQSHNVARWAGFTLGRAALYASGTVLGLGLALQGAHREASLDGITVDVSTSVGSFNGAAAADLILHDPPFSDQNLGGITLPTLLKPLPINIHATAVVTREPIEQTIARRVGFLNDVRSDATHQEHLLITYFEQQAAKGAGEGLAIAFGVDGLLALWRRRQARDNTGPAVSNTARRAIGTRTAALLTAGASLTTAALHVSPNLSDYKASGLIAAALHSEDTFSTLHVTNPVLTNIFQKFEAAHACPDLPVPSGISPVSAGVPDMLTVTTYNIKSADYGFEGIEQQLAATESDIILLQEATEKTTAELAADLDMTAVTGWTIQTPTKSFGDAILLNPRLTVTGYQSYLLPDAPGIEPRLLLVADVETPQGEHMVVADTHLTNSDMGIKGDANGPLRIKQAEQVVSILKNKVDPDMPLVLTGDLNANRGSQAYNALHGAFADIVNGVPKVAHAATFPSSGTHLDNMFGRHITTRTAFLGGGSASDHCSVTAAIALPGTESPVVNAAPEEIEPSMTSRSMLPVPGTP